MRVVKTICDRCNKEFEPWSYRPEHKETLGIADVISHDGVTYLDDQKDLCESCYTEFVKWWLSGKNDKGEVKE